MSELLSTGILGDSVFFFLALVMFATLMFSPRAGSRQPGYYLVHDWDCRMARSIRSRGVAGA